MRDAERAVADHRRQLDLDRRRQRQRALRADEQMRKIDLAIRRQRIEIVAADAPPHFRETRRDFGRLALADRQEIARQRLEPRGRIAGSRRRVGHTEMPRRSVGEHAVDRDDIVAHRAVAQ